MGTSKAILPPLTHFQPFQYNAASTQQSENPMSKNASSMMPPPATRQALVDMTNSARPPVTINLDELPTVKPGPYPISSACLSKKRTLDTTRTSDSPTPTGPEAFDDGESETDDDADEELVAELDMDCDVVRSQIRKYLAGGTTAVAFRKLIRATPGSYNGFMKQHGRDGGVGSETYRNAVLFFAKRERRAERAAAANPGATAIPVVPAAAAEANAPAPKRRKQEEQAPPAPKKAANNSDFDVSDIRLDKEERDAVPVFDTCDDIRTKIAAHFRQPGGTQPALLRYLGAQFIKESRVLRSPQLNTFLRQKGPLDGNSSGIYYAAYVYFEKLRIKQGKKKTKKREEMERRWGPDGVDRALGGGSFWCRPGEVPVQDVYGCVTFQTRRG